MSTKIRSALSETMTSSCNSTGQCEKDAFSNEEVWRTLMAVYLGAILFLSLIFNGTVCLLFYKKTHLLNVSNCFVLNLIFCQLCMSFLVLPFSLFAVVSQDVVYEGHWCAAQGFFFTVVMVAQQLALLTISIDRNYAIMNSLRYPNVFTQTLCAVLIGFTWLVSIVISVPPLLQSGMGVYSFHRNQFLCGLDWTKNKSYLLVFSILAFGIPIFIESFCYVKIFFAAVGHSKRSSKVRPMGNRRTRIVSVTASSSCDFRSEASSGSSDYDESERGRKSKQCKAVRTIFLIALVYITCWVPYFIDSFLTIREDKVNANFSAAAICFLFSSSILNPIIYAYMNRVTRREMSRFVCGNSGANDGDEAISTSMSTQKSVWAQNKIRTKSNGGLNTDTMDTIVEETEVDDNIFSEPRSGNHLRSVLSKTKTLLRSPRNVCFKHSEQIVMQSKNVVEVQPTKTKVNQFSVDEHEKVDIKQVPCHSKEGSNVQHELPKWNLVKANKFRDHQRRRSSLKDAESYFAKGRRRRKRDCGSFLYFEHVEDAKSKSTSGSKQKVHHANRYSLDHVQSISLGQFPGQMKLRLSLNESELVNLNKVTVKSNFEFENNSYDIERPQSNPEMTDIKNATTDGNVYTTEHWPGKVSVWTSIRRKSPSSCDNDIDKQTDEMINPSHRSDTSNSLQLSSSPTSKFVRLHSAPARCERNNASRKSRASESHGGSLSFWKTSLPNETHM